MLEPREADIPVLFLVLVVLPLVAYVLLGKWSEATKKRERINFLAQMATEEAFRAEAVPIATDTVTAIPFVSPSKNGIHVCARCSSPATTRCSRCKSVRYCSGRCQIIHWRQVHKQECQQLETASSCSSPNATAIKDSIPERASSFSINDSLISFYPGHHINSGLTNNAPSENSVRPLIIDGVSAGNNCSAVDAFQEAMLQKRSTEKWVCRKSKREMLIRRDVAVLDSSEENFRTRPACLNSSNDTTSVYINGQDTAPGMHVIPKYLREPGKMFASRSKCGQLGSLHSEKNGMKVHETETDIILNGENISNVENTSTGEMGELNCSCETTPAKGSVKSKCALLPVGSKIAKSSKSTTKGFEEKSYSELEGRGKVADDSKAVRMGHAIPAPRSNGVAGVGIVKMMGVRRSTRITRQDVTGLSGVHRRMLFPYEEFVKIFNCDAVNLSPTGLVNCGNSCYANAVLQCLTCTKPLVIFLLHRSHSRACCGKDWCLICELEKHVMLLRECSGPLSPRRILLHMQNINCQIGGGNQEDAHEFLRLLVASMQAICLEGLGGEDKVNPLLQETTFIQHTFGGRLRSKVKCLRCDHESERHESIMDLTLEIFGWVESLEDALTQFTTPEELDGENMYRCGRCAAYVRARKQLSIHEAPNILTIVLKRFQEGQYGKINKCITFPDMLDMIPFMTGTEDIPPLYLLYAVVVHLDTLNASFSGHYVAYVKDLNGNWFRVDDAEVHPVPMSQVMSEGAYILFYMRSCPRPQREFYEKPIQQQGPPSARHCSSSRMLKPSSKGHGKSSSHFLGSEPSSGLIPEDGIGLNNHTNGILGSTNRNVARAMEFSDATSSDWSLFTSSDEASFTTESTRDSFSTVDYSDTCNADTFSSIFNNLYAPRSSSQNTFCCRTFSSSTPQTKFIAESEERGYVLDSFLSTRSTKGLWRGDSFKQISNSTEFPTILL